MRTDPAALVAASLVALVNSALALIGLAPAWVGLALAATAAVYWCRFLEESDRDVLHSDRGHHQPSTNR